MLLSPQVVLPTDSLATGIAFFGRGDGPIFIDQTGCFGNESRLLDCPHSGAGVHDCFHSEDAGAICTGTPTNRVQPLSACMYKLAPK